MIYVIASVRTKEGKRDQFLAEFHKVVPLVRGEEGCLEYGPTIDVETNIPAQGDVRPELVTIIEKWESLEHLEAHLVAPHMVEYRRCVRDLVEEVQLQILEPV